jgi:hypothetical protein
MKWDLLCSVSEQTPSPDRYPVMIDEFEERSVQFLPDLLASGL